MSGTAAPSRPLRSALGLSPRGGPGLALSIAAIAAAALIALPILGVLLSLAAPLSSNWSHLAETVLPEMIATTAVLTVGTAIGVTLFGVTAAWLVTMCRFPGRALFEWALILPLAFPAYVLAYAYTDFLQHSGLVQTALRDLTGWGPRDYWFPEIRSTGGAVLIFSSVFYPYVYLLARAAFLNQSVCVLDASRSLGCTPWRSFVHVALPLARPAIVAGVALALMETLADFGASAHFGLQTFTTGIYQAWFSMGDRTLGVQLAAGLLSLVILLLVLERMNRGRAGFEVSRARFDQLSAYRLGPAQSVAAIAVCLIPLTIGFLVPLGVLVHLSLTAGHDILSPRYITLTLNSLTLAGITAACAVMIALLIAFATRLRPGRLTGWVNRIAGLGYALPGTVIAVGVLVPLAQFDNALDAAMRSLTGISTGLILTGGIAALIYAYLVRFLAVSLNPVDAALQRVTPSMEAAARSLGAGPWRTLRRVHVPMISGGLLTAGLIAFVEVMKELPATLILRPFNFDTLATQAYRLASDERLAEASTASLAIMAAGLLPVLILSRAIARSRPGG